MLNATAIADAIDLGSVKLNRLFKMQLPLPAALGSHVSASLSAPKPPKGVRIHGSMIEGIPKVAGAFQFEIHFKSKKTVVAQSFTLTVEP